MSDNSSENSQQNNNVLCCTRRNTNEENEISDLDDEIIKCPLNVCESNKADRIWNFLRPLNIIVFMLMFGMSISLRRRFRDNLIYRQLCIDRFKSDYRFCYEIKTHHNVTDADRTVLNILHLSTTHECAMIGLRTFIELFSACVFCSWSDSYGRKLPLLVALLGKSVELFPFLMGDIPFEYFTYALYFFTILSGLFGGDICIIALIYCLLTDHSSLKSRPLSFAMADFSYMLGLICGVVIFKNLLKNDIILASFKGLLVLKFILIFWVWLTVADKHFTLNNDELSKKIKLLFSGAHMKNTYKAMRRWRQNCQTEQLCLLMGSAVPVMMSYLLIEGIILVSANHGKLFPSDEDYNYYTFIFALYRCFAGPIAIIIFMKLSKFKDSTLGIIGCLNLYFNFFVGAFAMDYLTFLVGLSLTPLESFAVVGLRSAYSKIAEESERGKLFYFFASCEVWAVFFTYLMYEELGTIMFPRDDTLSHMVLCTMLVLPLCAFTFQVMSIHTSHLFEGCYRNIPMNLPERNVSPTP